MKKSISVSYVCHIINDSDFLGCYMTSRKQKSESLEPSLFFYVLENESLNFLGKKKNLEKYVYKFGDIQIHGNPDILEIDHDKRTIMIGEIKCLSKKKEFDNVRKQTFTQLNLYAMCLNQKYPDYKITLTFYGFRWGMCAIQSGKNIVVDKDFYEYTYNDSDYFYASCDPLNFVPSETLLFEMHVRRGEKKIKEVGLVLGDDQFMQSSCVPQKKLWEYYKQVVEKYFEFAEHLNKLL